MYWKRTAFTFIAYAGGMPGVVKACFRAKMYPLCVFGQHFYYPTKGGHEIRAMMYEVSPHGANGTKAELRA